jgi:hypothetical protein
MVGQTRPLVKGDKEEPGTDYSITPDIYNADSPVTLDRILAMAAWSITPADDSIAKYTLGLIEGVKAGSAKLSVSFGTDDPSTCTVTVKAMPPNLPLATIEPPPTLPYNFKTNYRFKLTWEKIADSDAEAVEAIKQVRDTWMQYTALINPLPFYDADGDGVPKNDSYFKLFKISADGVKLLNTDPGTNGSIIINRYWPETASTVFEWRLLEVIRANAFKTAVKEIETMMADIEGSPLYNLEDPENGIALLQTTSASMGGFIAYNPPTCTTRTAFSLETGGFGNKKAVINPDVTGPLYEYYLGYVPASGDYENPSPLAFPE